MYKRDALTGGHVIMLGASDANTQAALEALRAYPGGLQIGGASLEPNNEQLTGRILTLCYGLVRSLGGINADNCQFFVENGASHVIVTSYVFRDGQIDFERLTALKTLVGKEHLVRPFALNHVCVTADKCFQSWTGLPHTSLAAVHCYEQVLDLSCRKRAEDSKFYVMTDRWQKFTTTSIEYGVHSVRFRR